MARAYLLLDLDRAAAAQPDVPPPAGGEGPALQQLDQRGHHPDRHDHHGAEAHRQA